MAKFEMRSWAVKGAELRLMEIGAEARAIFAAFPELRARGRGFGSGDTGSTEAPTARPAARPQKRRRKMSAEARKRISDAQKARWAKQRAQTGASKNASKKK